MKVVTGYRMTPVELPSVGAAAHGRGFVFNLQRMLLRVRLACRHGVAALQRWSAQELGRPLVSADVRMIWAIEAEDMRHGKVLYGWRMWRDATDRMFALGLELPQEEGGAL